MTDSLRDQLLTLGFKPAPAPERKPGGKPPHARPGQGGRPGQAKSTAGQGKPGGTRGERRDGAAPRGPRKPGADGGPAEMDLGKAFALRAQKEKQERIEAEQRRQEEARQRREARARLEALLQDKGLNDPAAEIARHFE